MKKRCSFIVRSISLNLIFHALIISLMTALVIYGINAGGSHSLIVAGIIACIAVTGFAIWNIAHDLTEMFSKQANNQRKITARLNEISSKLQIREQEIQQCADTLIVYAAIIDSLAKKSKEVTELLKKHDI
jgi:hypothetical protein